MPDDQGDRHTDGQAEELHQQHGIGQEETPSQRYRPVCGHPILPICRCSKKIRSDVTVSIF